MILWLSPMTKTTKHPNLLWRASGLIVLALITPLFLIKLPSSGVSTALPLDKLIHLVFHFCLCAWFLIGGDRWAHVFCLSFLYGLAIEFAQYFTPDRSFELADLSANIIGAILAVGIYQKARRRFHR